MRRRRKSMPQTPSSRRGDTPRSGPEDNNSEAVPRGWQVLHPVFGIPLVPWHDVRHPVRRRLRSSVACRPPVNRRTNASTLASHPDVAESFRDNRHSADWFDRSLWSCRPHSMPAKQRSCGVSTWKSTNRRGAEIAKKNLEFSAFSTPQQFHFTCVDSNRDITTARPCLDVGLRLNNLTNTHQGAAKWRMRNHPEFASEPQWRLDQSYCRARFVRWSLGWPSGQDFRASICRELHCRHQWLCRTSA